MFPRTFEYLPYWLLLATTDHLIERDTIDFDYFESDSRQISVRAPHTPTYSFDENFIMLIDEGYGAVTGSEGGQLVTGSD